MQVRMTERERERARDPQTQTGSKQDGKGKENCDGGGIAGIWARVPKKRLVHGHAYGLRLLKS